MHPSTHSVRRCFNTSMAPQPIIKCTTPVPFLGSQLSFSQSTHNNKLSCPGATYIYIRNKPCIKTTCTQPVYLPLQTYSSNNQLVAPGQLLFLLRGKSRMTSTIYLNSQRKIEIILSCPGATHKYYLQSKRSKATTHSNHDTQLRNNVLLSINRCPGATYKKNVVSTPNKSMTLRVTQYQNKNDRNTNNISCPGATIKTHTQIKILRQLATVTSSSIYLFISIFIIKEAVQDERNQKQWC